jgi:hypothetical protein
VRALGRRTGTTARRAAAAPAARGPATRPGTRLGKDPGTGSGAAGRAVSESGSSLPLRTDGYDCVTRFSALI